MHKPILSHIPSLDVQYVSRINHDGDACNKSEILCKVTIRESYLAIIVQENNAALSCKIRVKGAIRALNEGIALAEENLEIWLNNSYSSLESVVHDKGWIANDGVRVLPLCVDNASSPETKVFSEVWSGDCEKWILVNMNETIIQALVLDERAIWDLDSLGNAIVKDFWGNQLHKLADVAIE